MYDPVSNHSPHGRPHSRDETQKTEHDFKLIFTALAEAISRAMSGLYEQVDPSTTARLAIGHIEESLQAWAREYRDPINAALTKGERELYHESLITSSEELRSALPFIIGAWREYVDHELVNATIETWLQICRAINRNLANNCVDEHYLNVTESKFSEKSHLATQRIAVATIARLFLITGDSSALINLFTWRRDLCDDFGTHLLEQVGSLGQEEGAKERVIRTIDQSVWPSIVEFTPVICKTAGSLQTITDFVRFLKRSEPSIHHFKNNDSVEIHRLKFRAMALALASIEEHQFSLGEDPALVEGRLSQHGKSLIYEIANETLYATNVMVNKGLIWREKDEANSADHDAVISMLQGILTATRPKASKLCNMKFLGSLTEEGGMFKSLSRALLEGVCERQ